MLSLCTKSRFDPTCIGKIGLNCRFALDKYKLMVLQRALNRVWSQCVYGQNLVVLEREYRVFGQDLNRSPNLKQTGA